VARESGVDPDEIEEVFTYQQYDSYIAISKQTPKAVVRQWQEALDEMKADGTFWWLTRKWLPPDAIVMSLNGSDAYKKSVLNLYTENSPPSSFMQDDQIRGLSVEIVRELLRRVGQADTIALVPWARGYELALSDPDTALFSTTRLSQRETLFSWVGPLYRQQWGFYKWKGSAVKIEGMEAAKRVARIGTYRKDAKMQFLRAQGFENLVPTNNNVTNLKHLLC
jgi:ABC-type amino acid transport substrate-binding protein